jgi:lipid A 4'-phosphatase
MAHPYKPVNGRQECVLRRTIVISVREASAFRREDCLFRRKVLLPAAMSARCLTSVACILVSRLRWPLLGIVVAVLALMPAIDITVSSWFWDPAHRVFVARVWPPAEWVRLSMPRYMGVVVIAIAALWAAGEWAGQVFLGVSRRVAVFLLASLAIGPGVIVNLMLKPWWGRPRPSTILEFGGANGYVPPMVVSNACSGNCSFPSGHAALGFWLVSFALLAPPRWRISAIAIATFAGALVGAVRIAQGGHFLSDVVFSGLITISVNVWLYRRIASLPKGASSKNNPLADGESP